MARRETLRQLEARTLREQGDLPPPLDMDVRRPNPLLYNTEETPLSYKQASNLKPNPRSAFTIIKPLRPNILDVAAIRSVHRAAAIRKKSGHKWVPVQDY